MQMRDPRTQRKKTTQTHGDEDNPLGAFKYLVKESNDNEDSASAQRRQKLEVIHLE